MKWYTVDENFLTYLRNYESRIPNINYGEDKFKPFFGELFKIDELVYITQVSHPQPRHSILKENLDFIKLYDEDRLIAVVNLNYMFPVHREKLIEVEYKNIQNFRTFKSDEDKDKFIHFLKMEMKEIVSKNVIGQAEKLYKLKYDFPHTKISLRCLDFKDLERKCIQYHDKVVADKDLETAVKIAQTIISKSDIEKIG